MKKLISFSLFILLAQLSIAQIKVGQPVNDSQLKKLLNAPVNKSSLAKLKGRVIWLEFWATWCEPCVNAMPALQKLQKAYKGKLQIVAISTENEKRIRQFLINKPSNLWFASDTADSFKNDFPYHTIPHSVLINAQGIVVAITEPENITAKVIADVIAGRPISLPLKQDNMLDKPWLSIFPVADTVKSSFVIQPQVAGMSTMYMKFSKDSIFKNRRICLLNADLELAYRIAYGDVPYNRILNLTPKTDSAQNQALYCIDIIVPKGDEAELLPKLRKELNTRFDMHAAFEKKLKTVEVLQISDPGKIARLVKSSGKPKDISAGHGSFNGHNIALADIGEYLEGFGLVRIPVVDETGDHNKYDIAFTFMPEKKGDLDLALSNLGLALKKEDRTIDLLVFR